MYDYDCRRLVNSSSWKNSINEERFTLSWNDKMWGVAFNSDHSPMDSFIVGQSKPRERYTLNKGDSFFRSNKDPNLSQFFRMILPSSGVPPHDEILRKAYTKGGVTGPEVMKAFPEAYVSYLSDRLNAYLDTWKGLVGYDQQVSVLTPVLKKAQAEILRTFKWKKVTGGNP